MNNFFAPGATVRILRCGCTRGRDGMVETTHLGSEAVVNCDVRPRLTSDVPMPRLILCTLLPDRSSGCTALEAEALV